MQQEQSISNLAKKRSSEYAPPASHAPLTSGLVGAFIVYLVVVVVVVFCGMSGLDFARFQIETALIMGVGFLAPYTYFKRQQNKHIDAYMEEYNRLLDHKDNAS